MFADSECLPRSLKIASFKKLDTAVECSLMEQYRNKQVDPPEWGDGTQDVIPLDQHPQDVY